MRSLVVSIMLYACETWTVTAEIERMVQATEMRFFRRLLGITYRDRIKNIVVRDKIRKYIGPYEGLAELVRRRKLRWYGHVIRSEGMAKRFLQGTVRGKRRRGRQKKRWEDNICEWTGLNQIEAMRRSEDRKEWRRMVEKSCAAPTVIAQQ